MNDSSNIDLRNISQQVVSFIYKKAVKQNSRILKIPIVEFEWIKIPDNLNVNHVNFLRWTLKTYLQEAKITFKIVNNSFDIIIDESINLKIFSEEKEEPIAVSPIGTFSNWKDPFSPPSYFKDLIYFLRQKEKPILIGPKGCGKSRSLEEAMAILGRKVYRIALPQYRDPVELIGDFQIVEENGIPITKFIGGVITTALQEGYGLIIDEIDSSPPHLVSCLQQFFEPYGTQITIKTESGILNFSPHKDALIAATSNTWRGDDKTGEYSKAQGGDASTWDRFFPKIDCDYDVKAERLTLSNYLPQVVLDALFEEGDANHMGIIPSIRRSCKDPNSSMEDSIGFRSILRIGHHWKKLGWHKIMYYFVNEFKEENREAVSKIITNKLGREFIPTRNDYDESLPDYIPNLIPKLKEKGFIM